MIHDPWGRRYLYELDGEGRPRVRSLGRDGQPGGSGPDADIGLDSLDG
jgi:general secretion pathway protein G